MFEASEDTPGYGRQLSLRKYGENLSSHPDIPCSSGLDAEQSCRYSEETAKSKMYSLYVNMLVQIIHYRCSKASPGNKGDREREHCRQKMRIHFIIAASSHTIMMHALE